MLFLACNITFDKLIFALLVMRGGSTLMYSYILYFQTLICFIIFQVSSPLYLSFEMPTHVSLDLCTFQASLIIRANILPYFSKHYNCKPEWLCMPNEFTDIIFLADEQVTKWLKFDDKEKMLQFQFIICIVPFYIKYSMT